MSGENRGIVPGVCDTGRSPRLRSGMTALLGYVALAEAMGTININPNAERMNGWTRVPFKQPEHKLGRNDPCHCGSGRKFKKCCGTKSK